MRAVVVRICMISCPVAWSSAPVGSSAKTTEGDEASARAMATRWACPPDISPGLLFRSDSSPTLVSHESASLMADRREAPASMRGRATFSFAGSSGTSWPSWKTNPKAFSRRRERPASFKPVTDVPPTVISPDVTGSIPERQCRRVDLPEPDGPMTATDCPAGIVTSTPASALTAPKFFTRFRPVRAVCVAFAFMFPLNSECGRRTMVLRMERR